MPRPESEALGYLYDRFIGDDPEHIASYEKARAESAVASAIYALRTEAGLSQRALADRVGTTASVICRLEDADYDGHSLLDAPPHRRGTRTAGRGELPAGNRARGREDRSGIKGRYQG